MGFPRPSLNVVIDDFSHSCLKMCKIYLKRTLDATFLDCLALTFCDVIGELLPEWACLTLQGGTTFLLTSKLADIPVSRMRKRLHISHAYSTNDALSNDTKVNDLVTLTLTLKLKIAFWTLLSPGAYCFTNTPWFFSYKFYCIKRKRCGNT